MAEALCKTVCDPRITVTAFIVLGIISNAVTHYSYSIHYFRHYFKGSAHCRRPRIFGFLDFSENVDFWNFPVGFGVWGGLQWIGNGCGLQIDGFSAQTDSYESIFKDFYDFDDFGIVFGGLTLLGDA